MATRITPQDDGSTVATPEVTPVAATPVAATPRQRGPSDYDVTRDLCHQWPGHIAFKGGSFWSFSVERGWEIRSSQVQALADRLRGRSTTTSVMEILKHRVALPDADHCALETVYWERVLPPGAPADANMNWHGVWRPFSLPEHQILFTDGIYDLATNEILSTEGRVIFGPRISLPCEIPDDTEEVRCQEFEDMVALMFPDLEKRRYFQEIMSLTLIPHLQLRGQIVLWGPPCTAKTTIATAIACAPAGRLGYSCAQEAEIVRDKFASMALLNKFVNISDDSPVTSRWVGWMKRYTSGSILAEVKYHNPTSLIPTAKLLSCCNDVQELMDASGAAATRVYAFKLSHVFERHGNVDQDQMMTGRYWSEPDRRSGVLNWLLEGAIRVFGKHQGKLEAPEIVKAERQELLDEADPIREAIISHLMGQEGAFVPAATIWAFLGSMMPKDRRNEMRLARYIHAIFPKATKGKQQIDGINQRGWYGVKETT